jgi:hypothetical protein
MKHLLIPSLILALAVAPLLRAEETLPAAQPQATAVAESAPQITPVPTPAPADPAPGSEAAGLTWAQIGVVTLLLTVLVAVIAVIVSQPKGGSAGGSGSGGYSY